MRGLRAIALTDHDTVAGMAEADAAAHRHGIALIPGVEISVTWGAKTLHLLGLRIDPAAPLLLQGLTEVRATRMQRAEQMAMRLQREGICDRFEAVLASAADGRTVSRTHFARQLVALGVVKDVQAAFRRFLGEGKPAFVRARWAALGDAIRWIRSAGGVAVLAHPARYGLKPARLGELCREFKALGGEGLEVVSASHTPEDVARLSLLARTFELRASAGSDFHSPEESWLDLGAIPALPSHCVAVWQDWRECQSALLH